MNAFTFAATALIIMLPGFIAMFKLLSDHPHKARETKLALANTYALRVRAAAQAITQRTQAIAQSTTQSMALSV